VAGNGDCDVPVYVGLKKVREWSVDRYGLIGLVEPLEIGVGAILCRQLRADGLDRLARLEQGSHPDAPAADDQGDGVGHRLIVRSLHEGTACPAGPDADQALDFEDAQRLADRRPAHLGLRHEVALGGQRGALGKLAEEDPLAQVIREDLRGLGNRHRSQPDWLPVRPALRGQWFLHRSHP
jgi:hypothetical protein